MAGQSKDRAGLPRHLEEYRPPFDQPSLDASRSEWAGCVGFWVAVLALCVGGFFAWEWIGRVHPPAWKTQQVLGRVLLTCFVAATCLGAGALFGWCVRVLRRRQPATESRAEVIGYAILCLGWSCVVAWHGFAR